jgi:hypothetical protein
VPISFVSQATATANNLTLPSFQPADVAVIFAFRTGSTTNPTIPAGWTNLTNTTDGTSCCVSVGWRRLVSTDSASGTWTNATQLVCLVYRGCEPFLANPTGGKAGTAGTTTTQTFPTVTMTRGDGTSWVVGCIGVVSTTNDIEVAPAGMTNRADLVGTTTEVAGHDTNGGVASWSSTNRTANGAANWVSYVVELLAMPVQAPNDVVAAPLAPMAMAA